MFHKLKFIIVSLVLISFLTPKKAQALTSADAAIMVVISTAAGAAIGASTLPFYVRPSRHTKNIFYGASMGAVAGVLFAAYAGVQEGVPDEEEAAFLRHRKNEPMGESQWSLAEKIAPESTLTMRVTSPFDGSATVIWSPLAQLRF